MKYPTCVIKLQCFVQILNSKQHQYLGLKRHIQFVTHILKLFGQYLTTLALIFQVTKGHHSSEIEINLLISARFYLCATNNELVNA